MHVKAAPVCLVVYLIDDRIVRIFPDFIREHKSVHTLGESVSRYIFCVLFKKSMTKSCVISQERYIFPPAARPRMDPHGCG